MDTLLHILTLPDNIPIIGIFFLSFFFLYLYIKKARINDNLIKAGRKEDILDEMEK